MPNQWMPKSAMVLAAGLGTRMQPVTDRIPKPLVEVAGQPLIDHALGRLAAAGVEKVVINVHYMADRLIAHLGARERPSIMISDEQTALMETGGGVVKALPILGDDPFLLLNSDSFWVEGPRANLETLTRAWDASRMDALLMLAPTVAAVGYDGQGDFFMDAEGRLVPRPEHDVAPFVYTGVAMINPTAMFAGAPRGPFPLSLLINRVSEAGRLFGIRMDGLWFHVGTPRAIEEAERALIGTVA